MIFRRFPHSLSAHIFPLHLPAVGPACETAAPKKTLGLTLLLFVSLMTHDSAGQTSRDVKEIGNERLSKSAQTKIAAILNINNFTIWQQAHGRGAYPPNNAGDGGFYPRGTRWVIFADGFVWSTKVYLDSAHSQPAPTQLIRTGGSTYNVGNDVGWINGTGAEAVALGASHPSARIYRIRRDWPTMSQDELRRDAAENNLISLNDVTDVHIAAVIAQYALDWDEWPVEHGAPYIERNGIPGYQQPPPFSETFTPNLLISGSYDEPGLAGEDKDFPADQVIWCAFNDLNRGTLLGFSGCEPMGLEMQLTLWGYKQPGALGNLYFKRIRFVNKGGADTGNGQKGFLYLDSMFVGKWSDVELGHFADNLVGCDTTLDLAFGYNGLDQDAQFARFNLPPPSVGYALLAGPLVRGSSTDTAILNFRPIPERQNLPMTSFVFAGAGYGVPDPPFGNYEGALRWWKWLQGYIPDQYEPRLYPHPPGFPVTKFPMSGDPVSGTGFLDGLGTAYYSVPPGSRRFIVNTGPFQLAPLDTQEVVLAVVGGMGSDRLSSITVMKANVQVAHLAYQSLFTTPRAPRALQVTAVELDGQIVLEWGSNSEALQATEQTIIGGVYEFEGYNVYQLPTATANSGKHEAVRIATFDRKNDVTSILDKEFDPTIPQFLPVVLQKGADSGIRRSISLTTDALTGDLLRNGTEYSFAVTAYNYSATLSPRSLESGIFPIRVKPRIPFGVAGALRYGDSLSITHPQGQGTGRVKATVVNPLASTGDTYEVRFDSTTGSLIWSLQNVSKHRLVVSGQPLHSGPDEP
ncbi:MAG: hypothetical protein HYW57_01050, partial [Ignavibacteriales bacterium]|nr:hypothetical protein [Ignavibacteriales bacterium]